MTDGHFLLKTRLFCRAEQALNTASLVELDAQLSALRGGHSIVDVMRTGREGGNAMSAGSADRRHALLHVFGMAPQGPSAVKTARKKKKRAPANQSWWGDKVTAISSEGLAQTLQRMLFDLDGKPRRWPKRVELNWLVGYTYHFHVFVSESEQQITMTWVTPPKADHAADYARYQRALADALETVQRPRDPELWVDANFTRLENIWVVMEKRWALTHGRDRAKPEAVVWLPATRVEKPLTKQQDIVVARQLCEDFTDRFPQRPTQRTPAR